MKVRRSSPRGGDTSWPKPLQIAVNLSPAQFVRGDVVGLVHSILLETGLSRRRLDAAPAAPR